MKASGAFTHVQIQLLYNGRNVEKLNIFKIWSFKPHYFTSKKQHYLKKNLSMDNIDYKT